MTTFVEMHHPALPGDPRVEVPTQAEDLYAAHGWLAVDGNTPDPEPIYLTPGVGDLRYLKLGDVSDAGSTGGAELRAAIDAEGAAQGWGGGGAAALVFDQSTPSASWSIAHTFGRLPNVGLYVGGEAVEADVEADTGTVSVTFPSPTAGVAVLV